MLKLQPDPNDTVEQLGKYDHVISPEVVKSELTIRKYEDDWNNRAKVSVTVGFHVKNWLRICGTVPITVIRFKLN